MKLPFKMITETEMEKYRAETFWTKEPETIEWLEKMGEGCFVDIGANVGVYSLYAAFLNPGRLVYAIEPVLQNYLRLCENVKLNGFGNVIPLHLAISFTHKPTALYVKDAESGASGGQIDSPIDEHGKIFIETEKQFVWAIPLWELPINQDKYLKIDVDGQEGLALLGVKDPSYKSILVEINHDPYTHEIFEYLEDWGYERDTYYDNFRPHSSERRGGNPENIVFRRKNES